MTTKSDNRSYNYVNYKEEKRNEHSIVIKMISGSSRVIDLGCGDGALLHKLKKEKSIIGTGIEISPSGVEACVKGNLNVRLGRIDEPLPFEDNTFDFAICNVTIQMVMYPEILLQEMKRIAHYQIISFPNFAFWKNRLDLAVHGVMPRPMLFGYPWYSTGHIHQLSFLDFRQLVQDVGGLSIRDIQYVEPAHPIKKRLALMFPNMFQSLGVFLLEKE